jgi:septum formation protein
MTSEQIENYISTDEPYDKAGSYGIQGRFGAYVSGIEGDYNNVVGLPLARLCRTLSYYGIYD